MLAYLRSPAFLAPALDALVGAYARPQALLARAPDAIMLAYARSPAFLALAPDAVMLAYLRSPAFLTLALFTAMLTFLLRRHLEQDVLLSVDVCWFFSAGCAVAACGRVTLMRWTVAKLELKQC